jgi:two-component system chemotaxis response regulator CheB
VTAMSKIRVLVVEDSMTIRKRIVEILSGDPDLDVVAEAEDGKTAIALCERHRPDVMTLDMMLPVMSGVAATEYIMAHFPTPILIVSASTNRGELFRTYDALAAGAVEVLEKASGKEPDGAWERELVATVKLVSRIKVITHLRGKLSAPAPPVEPAHRVQAAASTLVAIGGSTGAPAAVCEILRALPADFPLPVLLVVHIAEAFGGAFAEWLDGLSPLRVACARDGDVLPAVGSGRVLMAPPDAHLVLRAGRLRLTRSPERHSCRPSVDVLFESVAEEVGPRAIACLLTGMGKDGASGLLAVRRAGGLSIAQDEETSVVYGMPREAVALGAAERVLPLPEIGPTLARLGRLAVGGAR